MEESEVLTAASSLFDRYIATVVQLGSDTTSDASVLRPYAGQAAIDEAEQAIARLRARGQRMDGRVEVERMVLQDKSPDAGTFTLLICEDLTKLRIVDAEGIDVTPESRSSSSTVQVSFSGWPDDLRVERNVKWTGASVC